MKITTGKTDLNIILSSIGELILNSIEFKSYQSSKISLKIKQGFYEKLLLSPLVFYVPNNTISENRTEDIFEKYAGDIFYIEHLYELILCMNLSPIEQKSISINWIICEMNFSVKKTRAFHDIAFLDYYIEKNKKNTNGRLDYELMDIHFFQYFKKSNLKSFLIRPRKYFYTAIFGIVSAKRKGQYAKQKLKYIENPSMIEITDKDKKMKYNFHCPICDCEHLVYLNGNIDGKENVKKYITLKNNYIEFLCGHEGTDYSDIVNFSFDAVKKKFVLQTEEQYNQAFLYLFYTGKYNKGQIDFYKNEKNKKSITVEEFHTLRSNNE
jgi:hypothetical protein